jgi:hypothetical protein
VKMGETLSCVSLGATGIRDPLPDSLVDPLAEGLTANVDDEGCAIPVPIIAEELWVKLPLWVVAGLVEPLFSDGLLVCTAVAAPVGLRGLEPSCPSVLLPCPAETVLVVLTGLEPASVGAAGTVSVKVVGFGPHSVQTVTVVVQPSAGGAVVVVVCGTVLVLVTGRVSVTVVGVGAQCVQTVTVVVQPSGGGGIAV